MFTSTMHSLGRLRDLRYISFFIFIVNVIILINSSILLSTTTDTHHGTNTTTYNDHCYVPYNSTQHCSSTEYFIGHFDDKRLTVCDGPVVLFRYYVNNIPSSCYYIITEYEWDTLRLFVKSITTDLEFSRHNHSVRQ